MKATAQNEGWDAGLPSCFQLLTYRTQDSFSVPVTALIFSLLVDITFCSSLSGETIATMAAGETVN